MTTRNTQARIKFEGGWSTDFGPTATVAIDQSGVIRCPFLVDAENCSYDLDGGPRKIGGTERIHTTALNSGTSIRGLTDFWVLGTGSTHTQHRVVHVGNQLMKDDADGTFTSILGALAARSTTSVPNYSSWQDQLIIMSDAQTEVPLKWTGSGNASALGTNTPDCAFGIVHKNRFWMAGDLTQKSRLYYSPPLPLGADGDWNEVEAGFIDVDPDDGDELRGLASHKGELWVFKGPYNGSIHRVTGDTPLGGVTVFATSTQPQPFELNNFVRGLGAAGQNSIFRFRDDIGFIDAKTGSVRSLNATAAYGDFREAALSFPINDYLLRRVNKSRLKRAWAVSDVSNGRVLITLPVDGSATNNVVLSMDYRFDPPRWSKWPAIAAESLANVIDPTDNNRQRVFMGDTSGFVSKLSVPNRSINGTTAINYKVTLPFLDYGNPVAFKTIARGSVGIEPRGNYNGTFGWQRDDNAQQTLTFDQAGGDVLAGTLSSGTISGASDAGGGLTAFLSVNSLAAGDTIVIYATSPTDYDGTYTIVSRASTFFIISVPYAGDASSGNWESSPLENIFVLGTSMLAGSSFVDRFFALEEGGEFRSIQYQVTQSGLNEDIALHSLFTEFEVDADSTEN